MPDWLDKFKHKIKQAQAAAEAASTDSVAHDRFNDPFSHQVGWTPLKPGGSNFGTHYLVSPESGGRILMFKATKGGLAFGLVFLLVGLGILCGMIWQIMRGESWQLLFIGLFVGLPFSVAGIYLVRWLTKPRIFDLVSREFYAGFKRPDRHQKDTITDLNRVRALQLMTETVRGNKARYSSYELNLVLNDGNRVAVVDHGNYEQMLMDAEHLAKALHVPLWDNT